MLAMSCIELIRTTKGSRKAKAMGYDFFGFLISDAIEPRLKNPLYIHITYEAINAMSCGREVISTSFSGLIRGREAQMYMRIGSNESAAMVVAKRTSQDRPHSLMRHTNNTRPIA